MFLIQQKQKQEMKSMQRSQWLLGNCAHLHIYVQNGRLGENVINRLVYIQQCTESKKPQNERECQTKQQQKENTNDNNQTRVEENFLSNT